MKKLLVLFLVLVLFTGCAGNQVQDTTPPAPPVQETEPLPTLYQAGSDTEKQTGGAVRAYTLEEKAHTGLFPLGQDLLVVAGDGTLTLLRGDDGTVIATGTAELSQAWGAGDLQTREKGVIYFAQDSLEVVLLDTALQQTARIPLPENILGKPLLPQTADEIFYCVGTEIRALDMQTGTTRLVRQHSCTSQELTGSFFNDTIIGCRLTDEAGVTQDAYLYPETGEVIAWDSSFTELDTWQEDYFANPTALDSIFYLFGTRSGNPSVLEVPSVHLVPMLSMGGVADYSTDADGLTLRFYDLASGKCSAQVTIPTTDLPTTMTTDGNYIWIVAGSTLYRWDIAASPAEDDTIYTHPVYTAEAPDTEGLAACEVRADQLSDTYGLSIYLWQEAAELTPEYTAEAEYRPDALQDSLDRLENMLQQLPEDFIAKTAELSIYLVGSLESGESCAQFWSGSSCHVVMDCNDVERSFLWGLGFGVDTRVLGNSRDFDTWDKLNPSGFAYTYDYAANALREDAEQYADAFIDLTAMSFPTEDRSRIFACAVLPGNEEIFASDILQRKLLRLCQGIREAYGLDESPEILPWEQYLDNPIAADAS